VYLDPEWAGHFPAADSMEEEMLEFVAAERRPTSRLACQLVLPPECDGLRVFMPEMQS
jgi:ferredoxin, 2Fe-2S